MKIALWLLLDLLFLAVAASAQELWAVRGNQAAPTVVEESGSTGRSPHPLPDPPRPKVIDAKFLGTFGILAGAQLADGISTSQALEHGCIELNPVLGHHPGSVALYLGGVALFAGEAFAGYELKKHRKKWWIEPLIAAGVHGSLAFHNTGLSCR